jgi:hypothetical protein
MFLKEVNIVEEIKNLSNEPKLKKHWKTIESLFKIIPKYEARAKKILFEYLKLNYQKSCAKYYQILDKAHKECINYTVRPSKQTLHRLYEHISHALVFRAESYVSATTVYHIVYQNQAKPPKSEWDRIAKLIKTEGYKLSLIEQLGYLSRFHTQYSCDIRNCFHEAKFMRKYNKYTKRVILSMKNIRQSKKKQTRKRRVSKK